MKLVPYERIGEPEDIGNAAVFLASDMADYITGTSLFVDGGMTLYPGLQPAVKDYADIIQTLWADLHVPGNELADARARC